MKKTVAIIGLMVGVFAFTGCAQQYGPNGQGVSPVVVNLQDGRAVACVVASSGGVDCDWERAR